jgi:hypothetical protein
MPKDLLVRRVVCVAEWFIGVGLVSAEPATRMAR